MKIIYIAEIGNNHNGDLKLAKKMIDAALEARADYVKFQIYNIHKFVAKGNLYFDDFISESLTFDEFSALKKYTEEKGGKFLASPFDEDSLHLLKDLGLNTVKIASGDMNNRQLLEQAVEMGMRLIVSVGGASPEEIEALDEFLNKHNADFAILHCVISYPASFPKLNLNYIRTLKESYACRVGYSDHSLGIEASLAAIALGAEIIEKHFTIDRALPGGDNEMSVLPDEFSRLKVEGNNIAIALGSANKTFSEAEKETKSLIRREFYAKRDIARGTALAEEDIILLRPSTPGQGFGPEHYYSLLGKVVNRDIKKGQCISRMLVDDYD